jgi:hypothetical protein
MDFYQGVVVEFLNADRAVFVNPECCLQLNPGRNPDVSGPHWYCDAVATNFRTKSVFLCEISYSLSLEPLYKRLKGWSEHWNGLCDAIQRDCCIPEDWRITPWLFVPERNVPRLEEKLTRIGDSERDEGGMPKPIVTTLEEVTPWRRKDWKLFDLHRPDWWTSCQQEKSAQAAET